MEVAGFAKCQKSKMQCLGVNSFPMTDPWSDIRMSQTKVNTSFLCLSISLDMGLMDNYSQQTQKL